MEKDKKPEIQGEWVRESESEREMFKLLWEIGQMRFIF